MKTGVDYIGVTTSFLCRDEKGKFLLHKRSNACRDERGTWDCGAGQLEFGLTLQENVFKELREEYGCAGTIQEQLPTRTLLRTSPAGKQTHWILVPFIILLSKEEVKKVKIGDSDKMVEIGWFSLNQLPTPLHSGFKKTLELHKNKLNEQSK